MGLAGAGVNIVDSLYRRYGNVNELIDTLLVTGQLSGFIDKLQTYEEEDMKWEIWLHKAVGKTYREFWGEGYGR